MAAVVKNGVPGTELEQTSGIGSATTGPVNRGWWGKGHIAAEHLGNGKQPSPNPSGGNSGGMKKGRKGY